MYIPPSILDHDSLKTEVDALRGYINRIAPEALVKKFFSNTNSNFLFSYHQQREMLGKEMQKRPKMHLMQSIK